MSIWCLYGKNLWGFICWKRLYRIPNFNLSCIQSICVGLLTPQMYDTDRSFCRKFLTTCIPLTALFSTRDMILVLTRLQLKCSLLELTSRCVQTSKTVVSKSVSWSNIKLHQYFNNVRTFFRWDIVAFDYSVCSTEKEFVKVLQDRPHVITSDTVGIGQAFSLDRSLQSQVTRYIADVSKSLSGPRSGHSSSGSHLEACRGLGSTKPVCFYLCCRVSGISPTTLSIAGEM